MGASEAEISYSSSTLNTGSGNIYKVRKNDGTYSEVHPNYEIISKIRPTKLVNNNQTLNSSSVEQIIMNDISFRIFNVFKKDISIEKVFKS